MWGKCLCIGDEVEVFYFNRWKKMRIVEFYPSIIGEEKGRILLCTDDEMASCLLERTSPNIRRIRKKEKVDAWGGCLLEDKFHGTNPTFLQGMHLFFQSIFREEPKPSFSCLEEEIFWKSCEDEHDVVLSDSLDELFQCVATCDDADD